MKVYYAHCQAIYSTPQEDRDIETLESLGMQVINPCAPHIKARILEIRKLIPGDAGSVIMDTVFRPLVERCDALAFRALPDGSIPAGVAQEIAWAVEFALPVIELPSSMTRRTIGVAETREYLREIGQR